MELFNKVVRIVKAENSTSFHNFPVGTHVRIKDHNFDMDGEVRAEYLDSSDLYFIQSKDFEFIEDEESRGFLQAVGRTVESVDTSCINVVHIHFTDGFKLSVDAEASHHGIPVIQAVNTY